MGIRMRAKIGIAFLSISVLISFGLTSNQAFAGVHFSELTCEDCFEQYRQCDPFFASDPCHEQLLQCFENNRLQCLAAVGGEFIGIETTSVLAAGAQYTAAWMIPAIVSAIGIGIVIARKF